MDIEKELAALQQMTATQLRAKYTEVWGEESRSGNKQYLVKKIAWRIQALAEPDIEEKMARIRAKALAIANDADLRVIPPREKKGGAKPDVIATLPKAAERDSRLPPIGASIVRTYKGKKLQVRVEHDGFSYDGKQYATLSAVAKHITGSHCNGFLFFQLADHPRKAKA